MPTADLEPLSDERLDMLEDDFRAGRGCFSGWGLALVAEVRQLRVDNAFLRAIHGSKHDMAREIVRMRTEVRDFLGCGGPPPEPDDQLRKEYPLIAAALDGDRARSLLAGEGGNGG